MVAAAVVAVEGVEARGGCGGCGGGGFFVEAAQAFGGCARSLEAAQAMDLAAAPAA